MAMLRHVVLIRFKPETAPDRIRAIESAFAALQAKIAGIEALEWGTNCSPEGKDQGFTHCFLLTFASAAARDAYLPPPRAPGLLRAAPPPRRERAGYRLRPSRRARNSPQT